MYTKTKILYFIAFLFIVYCLLFTAMPALAKELPNPLGNVKDIPTLIANIIKMILGLVGVIALVMFIYGGILWMTSGGNPEQVKKGKDTLIWAILGLAIIFLAYTIVQFVIKAIVGSA